MSFNLRFSSALISLAFVALGLSGPAVAQVERIPLKTSALDVEVTPDIGGRMLSIALKGGENFLRVGEAVVTEPDPYIAPDADNVGYLAQEIWVGPQSQWWTQQRLNAERAEAKAIWPPDPYLILSKNQVLQRSAEGVALQAPPSPISGLVLSKSYSLVAGNPSQVRVEASARNFRDTPVAWDIWFNARVAPTTQVYVPVARAEDVRINQLPDDNYGPVSSSLKDGFFQLDLVDPAEGKQGSKGKVFIQPAAGWIAAFRDGQALILQFPLQPKNTIHPEQGQVELYLDYLPDLPKEGVLELEVHAPYKQLAPDASMSASETWTLLPYTGADTRAAHLAFLHSLKL